MTSNCSHPRARTSFIVVGRNKAWFIFVTVYFVWLSGRRRRHLQIRSYSQTLPSGRAFCRPAAAGESMPLYFPVRRVSSGFSVCDVRAYAVAVFSGTGPRICAERPLPDRLSVIALLRRRGVGVPFFEQRAEIVGQFALEIDSLVRHGVYEAQRLRMQSMAGHYCEAVFDELLVFREGRSLEDAVAAVAFVVEERMALPRHMDADLVRSTRLQAALDMGEILKP